MRHALVLALLIGGCFNPALSTKPCDDDSGCPAAYFCDVSRAIASVAAGMCSQRSEQEPVADPITLFESLAKQPLVSSCSLCHSVPQGTVGAFLAIGAEYQSITSHRIGVFLNAATAAQSLLLQKGAHIGPAFNTAQYIAVQTWLDAEIAFRNSRKPELTNSYRLPTAPLAIGDFTMRFGSLAPINDAQVSLTFSLAPAKDDLYRVSQLKLAASPNTSIFIKSPKFYFISANSTIADSANSLDMVELGVEAGSSMTVGSGTVLLSNTPINDPNARIGVAFQIVKRAN